MRRRNADRPWDFLGPFLVGGNMITAVFTDNDDYSHAYGLWQWDYGQQLRIEGLHLPTAVEIHFALQETGGEAIPRVGTTKDGVTTVTIPDSMLEGNSTAWTAEKTYNIYAWVYLSDKLSGETIKRITMQVKSRPKPEAFEAPGDGEIFHEAIEAVNDAAKRAEEAGDKAVSAADEAKAAATQTAEHLQVVQGLAEQVETNADTVAQDKQTVAGMLSQTQQAASDAALSAQAAKLSETAAGQAQTGAEAAEDTARQYAEETEADRQAVANDKQVVSQMREAVAADRQAVEQTAAQFGQTAQDALTAIGQAQSTAVGAVKAEGNKQTTAVQEAGTQAVSEVAEAKTTAVQAVTTEGDKQTKRVEDAAAGIVADREQISQNKTDIAGLVEGMTDLAPAIHSTASGSVITANDATEGRPFRGLRVFGKSTQRTTTGAQLLSIKQEDVANKDGLSAKVNVDGGITVTGTPDKQYATIYGKDIILSPGKYYLNGGNGSAGAVLLKARITFSDGSSKNCANGSFEVTPDTKSVSILIQYESATIQSVNYTIYPMLNKGETALPFEPYTGGKPSPSPEYPQGIVSAGEGGSITVEVGNGNLFKTLQHSAGYYTGEPGSPVRKNTNTGYSWEAELLVLPGTELTLSVITSIMSRFRCYVIDDNGIILLKHEDSSANSVDYTHTFVVPDRGAKMYLSVMEVSAPEGTTIMLNSGKAALPYEPYRAPQTLTLATPNGLPGVPVSKDGNYTDADGQQWICDEIDLERGKYVQRIGHNANVNDWVRMPGNPDIESTTSRFALNIENIDNYMYSPCICNRLSYAKVDSYGTEGTYATINETGVKRIFARIEGITSLEDFRAAMPDLEVIWLLETPIETDLPAEEIAAYKALRTYGPTTVITNDAGAGMEVTYVADTKAYIDKKFKELNQAIVNTQIALL